MTDFDLNEMRARVCDLTADNERLRAELASLLPLRKAARRWWLDEVGPPHEIDAELRAACERDNMP